MNEITQGTLLDGRVIYKQCRAGHRSGFEPVLLAACVPARPGEWVLETGTGAGAALLCLSARVADLRGMGVERVERLAALASENLKINNIDNFFAIQADATSLPFPARQFHHVLANPPWFGAASTPSPDSARTLAHHAPPGLLQGWIAELARVLRWRGSLSLILPAAALTQASAALRAHGFGGVQLLPLWPRAGVAAKMFILRARLGGKAPDEILPGLILHDESGITPAAQAVLRGGAGLL